MLKLTKKEMKDLELEVEQMSEELGDIEFGGRKFKGVPRHVAIICDGNRTWARKNGLEEEEGHRVGAKNILMLLHRAGDLGVEVITVWVGDTKNLQKRGKQEIKNLLKILLRYSLIFKRKYLDKDLRFRHIGARNILPKRIQKILTELEHETRFKKTAVLNVAFNYGGRDELVRVIQKLIRSGKKAEEIDEKMVSSLMDTNEVGDPDMIIRTGGELRLSGFMPWQSAPSELFFTDLLFPEFTPDEFEKMLKDFPNRKRKLGK
jgi:undecaprenyl diphosphate synthase